MVDTGANTLCLPPAIAHELQLDEVEKRQVKLADGGRHRVPYVGPVQLSFDGRHSALETVTVHPDSPGSPRLRLQSKDPCLTPGPVHFRNSLESIPRAGIIGFIVTV